MKDYESCLRSAYDPHGTIRQMFPPLCRRSAPQRRDASESNFRGGRAHGAAQERQVSVLGKRGSSGWQRSDEIDYDTKRTMHHAPSQSGYSAPSSSSSLTVNGYNGTHGGGVPQQQAHHQPPGGIHHPQQYQYQHQQHHQQQQQQQRVIEIVRDGPNYGRGQQHRAPSNQLSAGSYPYQQHSQGRSYPSNAHSASYKQQQQQQLQLHQHSQQLYHRDRDQRERSRIILR